MRWQLENLPSPLESRQRATALRSLLLLIFLVGFCAACRAEIPPDGPNWVYETRPHESLESIAKRHLKPGVHWTRLMAHNGLDNAFRLPPGTPLRIPIQWLKQRPAEAKMSAIQGQVFHRKARQAGFQKLTQAGFLAVGDELKTTAGSAVLRFSDGSELRIEADSHLIINRLTAYQKTGMTDIRIKLLKGRIENRVIPLKAPAGHYEVSTPGAVAAVRGTEFRIALQDNLTQAEVLEGVVSLSTRSGSATLAAGEGTIVSTQGLPRPRQLAPPPQTTLPQTLTQMPYRLNWQAIPNASAYRVQLQQRDSGQWLIDRQIWDTTLSIPAQPNGNYRLTLRSVDSNGLQGTETRLDFEIRRELPPPQLQLPEPGVTLPQARPVFRWRRPAPDLLASLEIAKEPEFVTLVSRSPFGRDDAARPDSALPAGDYYWRVALMVGPQEFEYSEAQQLRIIRRLADTQVIATNYSYGRVRVFWDQVPHAMEYTLQIAEDEQFQFIQSETTLAGNNASLTLDVGKTWFIRLKPEAGPLFTSDFGPVQAIRMP